MENPNSKEPLLSLSNNPENSLPQANFRIVVKTILDRKFNFKVIRSVLSNAWDLKDGVSFRSLNDKTLLCCFQKEDDMVKVLRVSPWNFKGYLLLCQQWNPELSLEELNFNTVEFWVQVHNLPPNKLNVDNAKEKNWILYWGVC